MPFNVSAKNKLATAVILVAVIGLVAFGYSHKAKRERVNSMRVPVVVTPHMPTKIFASNVQLPVITAFTPPGLGMIIGSVQANSTKRTSQVSFTFTNTDPEELENVEVLLLDFTSEGKLDAVIGRKFSGAFKPAAAQNLLLTADIPLFYNHTLLLTARATQSKYTVKEINMLELLTGLLTLKSTGNLPSLALNNVSREQVRVDSNFCHSIFRIAYNLNKGIPVTGYTCSQAQGEFLISYHSESLRKI